MDCMRSIFRLRSRRSSWATDRDSMSSWGIRRGRRPPSENTAFWARHFPGLRSQPQRVQEAEKARLRRERPDLVALYEDEASEAERHAPRPRRRCVPRHGDRRFPDLYKAFCWRFWRLAAPHGGRIGVVLPRSVLAAKGSTDFRLTMFGGSADLDLTMLLNRAGWVFDEAEHRYTIGLVAVVRRAGGREPSRLRLRGPIRGPDAVPRQRRPRAGELLRERGADLERQRVPAAVAASRFGRCLSCSSARRRDST